MSEDKDKWTYQSEVAWTRKLCKEMEAAGAVVVPLVGGGMCSGLPDRLIIYKDWQGLIEFKGPKTKIRLNQELMIRKINKRCNFFTVICRAGRDTGRDSVHADFCQNTGLDNTGGSATLNTPIWHSFQLAFDGTGLGLLKAIIELKGWVASLKDFIRVYTPKGS